MNILLEMLLTIEILEIGQLDSLSHAQNVGGSAETVNQHPDVACVQGGNFLVGIRGDTHLQGMLDIRPCCDERTHHHETEGKKNHVSNGAAEPKDLAVCNQDNGQVLEDRVDGNRQKLEGLCSGVNHADQEERDGEPYSARKQSQWKRLLQYVIPCENIEPTFSSLVGVEIPVRDDTHRFATLDRKDAHE